MHRKHLFIGTIIFAATLLTSSATVAQSKQSDILKAKLAVEKGEKAYDYGKRMYDNYMKDNKVLAPAVKERVVRQVVLAETASKDAKEKTDALDKNLPEVKDFNTRIDTLNTNIKSLRETLDGAQKEIDDNRNALEEGGKKDKANIERLTESLKEFSPQSPVAEESTVIHWKRMETEASDYVTKYADLKATTSETRFFAASVMGLQSALKSAKGRQAMAIKDNPRMIDEYLTKAKASADMAVANGTFGEFQTSVERNIDRASTLAKFYGIVGEGVDGFDAGVITKANARIKEIGDLKQKHEAKIIAQNEVPVDQYAGGDKASLLTLGMQVFKDANKGAKVLGIKMTESSWTRSTGWTWDRVSSSWVKFDRSFMNAVALVASPDGKYVYEYLFSYIKQHLSGDKVEVSAYAKSGKPSSPFKILLASKVK